MRYLKRYLETSAWNFYYANDAPEKNAITHQFFDSLPNNKFEIYASETVFDEFNRASEDKRSQLFQLIENYKPEILIATEAVRELANSYLNVLPPKSHYDALHIALATCYELDVIVSWNLRHIANLRRQEKVQAINRLNGYTKPLQMITPMEVIYYESIEDR